MSRSRPLHRYASAMTALDEALVRIDGWEAGHAAAAVVGPAGVIATRGDTTHSFRWASVTKLATALAVLVAVDRGSVSLDDAWGPPGSTVRHLLAHASGLPFEGRTPISAPGRRRIYSNPGFDLLGELLAERAGAPFETVLDASVLAPLGMGADSPPGAAVAGPPRAARRPRQARRRAPAADARLPGRCSRRPRPSPFPG